MYIVGKYKIYLGPSWPWSYGSWIYNYLCNQCLSPLMLWVWISIRARHTTLCDQVCQWLATGHWFSPGSPVSSTNKTDHHDIAEILLKVTLNTIKQTIKKKINNTNESESLRLVSQRVKIYFSDNAHTLCQNIKNNSQILLKRAETGLVLIIYTKVKMAYGYHFYANGWKMISSTSNDMSNCRRHVSPSYPLCLLYFYLSITTAISWLLDIKGSSLDSCKKIWRYQRSQ